MDILIRWPSLTRFPDDGRICLTNNAAERALRGIAMAANPGCSPAPIAVPTVRPSCTPLIVTAKLNDIDHQIWLAEVLGRVAGMPQSRLGDLLPWNWKTEKAADTLLA